MDHNLQKRVQFATEWVGSISAKILDLFYHNTKVEIKQNSTEVTEADRNTEKAFRAHLAHLFPKDGVIGEEFPELNKESDEFTWTIDPIYGTRSFVHGSPMFGTMIGLMKQRVSVFGIIHYHALGETIYAIKGQGCFWKGPLSKQFEKCKVSTTMQLDQATLGITGQEYFEAAGKLELFEQLRNRVKFWRTWGDCYGYCLVARGKMDMMVDPALKVWDLAPLIVIMQESGAVFKSIRGLDEGPDSESAITMNPQLWQQFHLLN